MKTVKYITSVFLFFLMFIFVGEIYVWNLESFETETKYVTFYLQENTSETEMMRDIRKSANDNNVKVFVVDKTINSLFSEKINIYVTDKETEAFLAEKYEIKKGNYDSIFLGTVCVEFFDWMELPDIGNVENYYVIGEDEDILNFKKSLVNKYAGRFPKEGYQAVNIELSIGIAWACVIFFLLLLTFYEVALQKKNAILRVTIGEQLGHFVFKNILYDSLFYIIAFISIMQILSKYTYSFYLKKYTYLFFCILLILNSFIYFWLFFTNYKKDMQTQESARKVLKISYVYKIITSIMLIMTMTGCMELIFEGLNCYRQKDFFEERKDYYYITVGGNSFDDARNMLGIYYRQGEEEGKKIGLVDLGKWMTDAEYIFADQGALNYLYTRIPEMRDQVRENKIYYLVPEDLMNDNTFDDMMSIYYAYYEAEYEYEIIGYENTAWVMAISNVGKVESTLKKNPVIILNNINNVAIPDSSILYIGNAMMYSFSNEEFENIAEENAFDSLHYRTNVYENYLYFWRTMKRNMLMGIVFLLILLALEGLILRSIIKYEYQINAKELLLSKIHGNSFFNRQKKIILILAGGWISLFIAIIICRVLEFSSTLYVTAGGILILLIELLFVAVYSSKLDHVNISKIFKGGVL